MNSLNNFFGGWPKSSVAMVLAGAMSVAAYGADTEGIDLLERYPTTLTAGDTDPSHARSWEFTEADIFRLTGFTLQVGDALLVESGPADVGIGHCEDGAVWAVVIPREGGALTDLEANRQETISHVWLRFHPMEVKELFPPVTVFADGERVLATRMNVIAYGKFRSSWHAGYNALIPEPKDMTLDVDTEEGPRRFYSLDTEAQTATYLAGFEDRYIPEPPAITPELAEASFDQLWEAFDQDYAMFVLRPEVNWTALGDQYRPAALASQTAYEFAGVCAEMLKPLRDLHVWLTVVDGYVPVFNRPRPSNANPGAYGTLLGDLKDSGSAMQWAITEDKISFIAIYGWSDQGIPAAVDEILESMRDTRGLIIDVRLNGGGSEPLAQAVAGRFLDRMVTYAYSQYRNGPLHTDLTAKTRRTTGPGGPWRYDRPVVLLIGQRCLSSNESFAAMMSCAPQVITMGDHTGGSSGNPRILELPLAITVSVPRWIDYLPDGTPLDEVGVAPQVPFLGTPDAFQGERDDLLAAALQVLKAVPLPDTPIQGQRESLVLRGTWPGYRRDFATAVAVSGTHAYVVSGALQIVDISDPAHPRHTGACDVGGKTGMGRGVAIAGKYAYVTYQEGSGGGLLVIDVADPDHPQRVGECDIGGWPGGVTVAGDRAYAAGSSGLTVIDVSDPTNPRSLGGLGTSMAAVAVAGNHAYVAAGDEGLQVIDVSNPQQPLRLGGSDTSGRATGVATAGDYVFLVDSKDGLLVFDVADPTRPTPIGRWQDTNLFSSFYATGIALSANRAYVAGSKEGLCVIDVTDPARPRLLGSLDTEYAEAVAVSGDNAYVADSGRGLIIISAVEPTQPQLIGRCATSGDARRVAIAGQYACVADTEGGLQVIDVSDPSQPRSTATFDLFEENGRVSAWGVAARGDYAYMADHYSGVHVIDLASPDGPRRVAQFPFITMADDVAISGDHAYVLEWLHQLHVFDVSNPLTPKWLRSLGISAAMRGRLTVAGNHASVEASWGGFQVIDISNPAIPRVVANFHGDYWTGTGITLSGSYAYMAVGLGVLGVFDISDPSTPQLVKECATGVAPIEGVAISGSTAYVVDDWDLHVFDLSDPADPRLMGRIRDAGGWDVAVHGDTICVAARWYGLRVLERSRLLPRFEPPWFGAAGLQLSLQREAGQTIRLQRSRDLKTWEDWVILTGPGTSEGVVDPAASFHPFQFYRAVAP